MALGRPDESDEIAAVFPSPLRRKPDSSLSIVAPAQAGVQGSGTGFQLKARTTVWERCNLFSYQSSMPVAAGTTNHENLSRRRSSPVAIGAESPCGNLRDPGIRVAPRPLYLREGGGVDRPPHRGSGGGRSPGVGDWIPVHSRNDDSSPFPSSAVLIDTI